MKIEKSINDYLKFRSPNDRYSSFDYCYNYFGSFYEKDAIKEIAAPENIYFSCLQIGFFLASWGMLRGSSFLLSKSVKHYEDLIHLISQSSENKIWNIDVDNYNDQTLDILLDYGNEIAEALSSGVEENVTDTQKTKIMLGIFGNVPVLDTYNKKSFGVSSFNKNGLNKIKSFYDENKEKIDSIKIHTLDYYTEKKLIDYILKQRCSI